MTEYRDSGKKVFLLSLPIFLELLLQLLVGNVDQIMVSRYSQESVAAVGNGNQVMTVAIIVLNVVGMASTVLISRYVGAGNKKKVAEICNVGVLVILVSGGITSLVLAAGRKAIFGWMKVEESIMKETCDYLLVVGSFLVVQGLYMVIASYLRSFQMVKEVMITSIVMNLLNIIGNWILIFGLFGLPRLGLLGAAISTDISKLIGLIIILILYRRKLDIPLSAAYLKPFPAHTLKQILFIALPSGGEQLSYNMSQVFILKMVNVLGTAVVATRVFCSMFANVAYVYSNAIAQATQIVIGYLVGGGETGRVPKRVYSSILISIAVSTSITALLYFNSDAALGVFTKDPAVLVLGKKILLIEFFLEIGRSVNIAMTRCLVAVGDVAFPTGLGIICMWSLAVGAGYLLGVRFGLGLTGIWIAMALDENVRAAAFLIRFKRGAWKKKLAETAP